MYSANLRPLGYQQITDVSASVGLTVPPGTGLVMVLCSGAAVRWRDDSVAPTAGVGYPLPLGSELIYSGSPTAIRFIQQSAGAVLDISYYGA